jgi:ABC-2 type transport system ATP-binding protein
MSSNILVSDNVTKTYGNFVALDKFSCDIPKGVTGLLGPNGAGKTTFIRTLLGIQSIDSGEIIFKDWRLPYEIEKARDFIGYQPEVPTKINKITAMKYVSHMGRMSGLPYKISTQRAFDTLHYVGLEEARYRDMNTFSQGMLQKVKLATALLHDPDLIILDEPTAGCDPDSRDAILKLIEDLGKNYDKNILFSTHVLPDIERTANYVVVVNHGKRVMQGNIREVLHRAGETVPVLIRVSGSHELFAKTLEENGFNVSEVDSANITCIMDQQERNNISKIFQLAKTVDSQVVMVSPYRQSLEDVFIEAVKGDEAN